MNSLNSITTSPYNKYPPYTVSQNAKPYYGFVYELQHISDPSFIDGMCGEIVIKQHPSKSGNGAVASETGLSIGIAGVLRPDVLDPAPVEVEGEGENKTVIHAPWSIKTPCACMEFNLSPFMAWREIIPVGSESASESD